jgi:hypothetical protein
MTCTSTSIEPALPRAKGPLSRTILGLLAGEPSMEWPEIDVAVRDSNPYGLDLQLACTSVMSCTIAASLA